MGTINVVREDGTVVAAPEELAKAATGGPFDEHVQTPEEFQGQADAQDTADKYAGAGNAGLAALEGLADTSTFGAYGYAFGGDNYHERAAAHPWARGAGELAALLIPGSDFTAVGGAKLAGEGVAKIAGKYAGKAAEGALLGTGATIADAQASNDPLTVESLVEGATIGGVLGAGSEALGSALVRRSERAVARRAAAMEEADTVKTAAELFTQDSPAWGEYRAARDGVTDTAEKINKGIEKEAAAYQDFVSDGVDSKSVKGFDKTLNEMREAVRREYPRATTLEGEESFNPEAKAANEFVADASRDLQRARAAMRSGDADTALGLLSDLRDRIKSPTGLTDAAMGAQDTAPLATADYDTTGRVDPRQLRRLGLARERAVQSIDYRANPPPTPSPDMMPAEGWQKMASQDANTAAGKANIRAVLGGTETTPFARPGVPELPELNNPIPQAVPAGPVPEFRNPFTEVTVPELPNRPRTPLPVDDVKLPKDLAGFAKMHPDTVSRLSNTMSDPEAQAVAKLAKELGLTPKSSAPLADIHARIRDLTAALKTAGEQKPGLTTLLRRGVKAALKYAIAAKTGGLFPSSVLNAATRAAGGTAADALMTATENGLLANAAVAARESTVSRLQETITKYGLKAGKGLRSIGPVTAYLSRSFPSGEPDRSTRDIRELAARRSREIAAAARTAPDVTFAALQPLAGAPNGLGLALHQHVVGAVNYLNSVAPKDPGLADRMFSSEWTPSQQDAMVLAYRLEATQRPMDALARHLMGDGHPSSAEALWKVWNGLMTRAAEETSLAAPQMKASFPADQAYSGVLGTPVGLSDPRILSAIQGMYLPKQQPGQQQAKGTPQDGGRPAAVRNPTAGSNVSMLVSQQQ